MENWKIHAHLKGLVFIFNFDAYQLTRVCVQPLSEFSPPVLELQLRSLAALFKWRGFNTVHLPGIRRGWVKLKFYFLFFFGYWSFKVFFLKIAILPLFKCKWWIHLSTFYFLQMIFKTWLLKTVEYIIKLVFLMTVLSPYLHSGTEVTVSLWSWTLTQLSCEVPLSPTFRAVTTVPDQVLTVS